jgi:hypothetical protein
MPEQHLEPCRRANAPAVNPAPRPRAGGVGFVHGAMDARRGGRV